MLWRLRRWKISISGGSQAGNWWLPRRIIFSFISNTIQIPLQLQKTFYDKERCKEKRKRG